MFVELVQERLQVPSVKSAIKYAFKLSRSWVLRECVIVVQVEQQSCSNIVWDYYFVFGVYW